MMELFLNYYFETEFEDLQRSSLLCRSKRREIVDYFTTIITGCCAGEGSEIQDGCKRAVIAAINFHQKKKTLNSDICLMGKYHNFLYVFVKLCYDFNLHDTETVAKLLTEIYQCEYTFERIQVGAIFGPTAPHFIAGWKSDFLDREENVRAMIYFLDHATKAKLTLDDKKNPETKLRFIDIPMESCGKSTPVRVVIQLGAPDLLLILLRFGANLMPDKTSTSSIETILDRLNEYNDNVYPFTLVACLKFILRSTRTIILPPKEENIIPIILGVNNLRDAFSERYSKLINNNLVPESRCGFSPPELKHLSRCVIREVLWQNYQLPHGIQLLKIPDEMQNYLDLQMD